MRLYDNENKDALNIVSGISYVCLTIKAIGNMNVKDYGRYSRGMRLRHINDNVRSTTS